MTDSWSLSAFYDSLFFSAVYRISCVSKGLWFSTFYCLCLASGDKSIEKKEFCVFLFEISKMYNLCALNLMQQHNICHFFWEKESSLTCQGYGKWEVRHILHVVKSLYNKGLQHGAWTGEKSEQKNVKFVILISWLINSECTALVRLPDIKPPENVDPRCKW